jgi:CheY-like chemotaxis protein
MEGKVHGKVVIGVDDVRANLILVQNYLQEAGFNFIGVQSGADCLAVVGRVIPKLILLDIEMPQLDGIETCRRLRQMIELRHVPIAFVTSRKSPETVKAAIAAGGNDFIVKPFEKIELLRRVKHWTSRTAAQPGIRPQEQ